MHIWLTQTGEPYPFQPGSSLMRTGILAAHLVSRGHIVDWWGSSFYHQKKEILADRYCVEEISKDYRVHLLKGLAYKGNLSLKRYVGSKLVAREFRRRSAGMPVPDVILAALPSYDLAYEAVRYGRSRDLPVLIDVRDPWPDAIVGLAPRALRVPARILLARDFHKTAIAMRGASGVIGISRQYLDWGLGHAGRAERWPDHIFPLGAKRPSQGKISAGERKNIRERFDFADHHIVFGFVGTFGRLYDLDLLLDAAEAILKPGGTASGLRDKVRFVIIGTGENQERITRRAKDLPNVKLTGWMQEDAFQQLLLACDVGMAPYVKNAHQSLPNKPFHYAAMGLPVLSSLTGEMAEMLDEFEMGQTYSAGNRQSLLDAISFFCENRERREVMGQNAGRLFSERFDAEIIYGDLVAHLEQVARRCGHQSGSMSTE